MNKLQTVRYGWKPDLPDQRDFAYRVSRARRPLPKLVDFRGLFPKVQDQLDLGSCTAHAIAGAMGALRKGVHYSRLFIYYQERVIERTVGEDAGAQLRSGVKACAKLGAPYERYCDYITKRFMRKPSKMAYHMALGHTITKYQRVNSLLQLRSALADTVPVVFGFSVYDSFESEKTALTGKVAMPGKSEPLIGGHAVCAVGYDDRERVVICRNSWGAEWGDRGYFYLPYRYVEDRNLSDDYWAIRG